MGKIILLDTGQLNPAVSPEANNNFDLLGGESWHWQSAVLYQWTQQPELHRRSSMDSESDLKSLHIRKAQLVL